MVKVFKPLPNRSVNDRSLVIKCLYLDISYNTFLRLAASDGLYCHLIPDEVIEAFMLLLVKC